MIRSPIVSVLGHVDHGKTSILDRIRDTTVASGEAGAITQAIGASMIPTSDIKNVSGKLLELTKTELKIPGLLFIDTPGHAAFSTMRSRGGSLADIAIVVIDINEGFKPQTIEAIEILKSFKTPFVIAANKIDIIPGYKHKSDFVIQNLNLQDSNTLEKFETKMYELVGELHEKFQINADRFDRVEDFTKKIGIIPTSAKLGMGIAELLMVVSGLSQKYLEENLKLNVEGFGRGSVLEVKEEKGLGITLNSILYDGTVKVNDNIVFAGIEKPIVSRVKALFTPKDVNDMRDRKAKFQSSKEVIAASGVKIICPLEDNVLSGMPFEVCSKEDIKKTCERLQKQVSNVLVDTDSEGVIVKADSIGSLEAMIKLLKEHNIKIRKASIGNISKKDIIDVEGSFEKNPLFSVILGFNIKEEESSKKVKIIRSDVIYKIIEDYELWSEEQTRSVEAKELEKLVLPCKIEILKNCIFRQNNPCILGVEVLVGSIKPNTPLMKADGKHLSRIKSIARNKESLSNAVKGDQVAISLPNVTANRQIFEEEFVFSDIPESDFRKLKKLSKYLTKPEIEIIREIAEIKRKQNPVWGV